MNEPVAEQLTEHRRMICCVLAVEIAEHDIRPVFEQIRMTQELRRRLCDATRDSTSRDLVSIEREGGALLCFVADAKACFTTALALRQASLQDGESALPLRIGISMGIVDTIETGLGEAYVSGEGRLDAERLMRQGPPCQVSVSRAFFELLYRAAPQLAACLQYQGVLADTVTPALGWYRVERGEERAPAAPATAEVSSATTAFSHRDDSKTPSGAARPYLKRSAWAPLSLLAFGVVFALSGGFQREPSVAKVAGVTHDGARKANAGESVQTERARAANPAPSPSTISEKAALTALPSDAASKPATASPDNRNDATTRSRSAVRAKTRAPPVQKPRPAAQEASSSGAAAGTIHLLVRPWGDVYVDGRHVGVTPPLKVFRVASGRRLITIRNDAAPIYRRQLTVAPHAKMILRHDFTCVPTREKPCRPPSG